MLRAKNPRRNVTKTRTNPKPPSGNHAAVLKAQAHIVFIRALALFSVGV